MNRILSRLFLVKSWEYWTKFIDGWIPKFAFFVPVLGYLILFNDEISNALKFQNLTGNLTSQEWFGTQTRIRLIYFGLLFLGVSNLFYHLRKPHTFRIANNWVDYTRTCLDLYTVDLYEGIQKKIKTKIRKEIDERNEGKARDEINEEDDAIYLLAKSYEQEIRLLKAATKLVPEGEKIRDGGSELAGVVGNWDAANKQFGGFLRDLLYFNFSESETQNLESLLACILMSSIGYLLLIAPSIDIFVSVVKTILKI